MADDQLVQWFDGEAIALLEGDPEPRMRSTVLARLLQYAGHHKLAALISRHMASLCELNQVTTVVTRPVSGGHEWDEYWLTEPQCIYLAAKSETAVANSITVVVIKQFDLYRKGLIIPNGQQVAALIKPVILDVVRHELQPIENALRDGLTELRFISKASRDELRQVGDGVRFCVSELAGSRKDLSAMTTRAHKYLLNSKFTCECPICRRTKILVDGELVNAAVHHHIARNNPRFDATIIICVHCHERWHHPDSVEFRLMFNTQFESYHHVAKAVGFEAKPSPPCSEEQNKLFTPESVN
jgi:hypothetical protein